MPGCRQTILERCCRVLNFDCIQALLLSHLMSRWARTSRMLCPPTLRGTLTVGQWTKEKQFT